MEKCERGGGRNEKGKIEGVARRWYLIKHIL